jgi:hypothetical protein
MPLIVSVERETLDFLGELSIRVVTGDLWKSGLCASNLGITER